MKPGFGTIQPEDGRAHEDWVALLMQKDYLIEGWHCDLSTGIFVLGRTARSRHGLETESCGLLDIIRCYHRDHHKAVLNILEEATATPSSFCFCTALYRDRSDTASLFCVGTSSIGTKTARMHGIFAFPQPGA